MEQTEPVVLPELRSVSRLRYVGRRRYIGTRSAVGSLPRLFVTALLLCATGFANCGATDPALAQSCVGDCNRDGTVDVTELLKGVNIALGNESIETCGAFDATEDTHVTVDELVVAVQYALNGCASLPLEVIDSRQVFSTHVPHGTENANAHAPDTAGAQRTLVIVATLNYSARANFHVDEQGNNRSLWDLTPEEFRDDVLWTLKGRPDTPTPHRPVYEEFFAGSEAVCTPYYALENNALVTYAHATGCSLSQEVHHFSRGEMWLEGVIVGPVQIPYDGDYYGWASATWGDPVALSGYLEVAGKAVGFLHRPSRLAVEKQASGIDCESVDCSNQAGTAYHWDREILFYSTDTGEWTFRDLGQQYTWLVPTATAFRRVYVLLYNEAPSAQARKAAAGQASGPQSAVYFYPHEDPAVRFYGSTFGSYGSGMGAVLHDLAHGLGGNLPSKGVLDLLRYPAAGEASAAGGETTPPVSWIVDTEQAGTFSPQDGSFYIRYDLKLNECVIEDGRTTGCESLPLSKFGYVCKHTHYEAGLNGSSRAKGICVPACPQGDTGDDACETFYAARGGIIPSVAYSCTEVNHLGQRGCSLARFQPVSAETNLPGAGTHVDSGWKWCRPSCVEAGTDSALGDRICQKGFGREGWTCRSPEPSDTVVQGADMQAAFAHCSDGTRTLCCFPPRQGGATGYEGDPLWCREAPEDRLFEAFDYQHALSLMGDRRIDDYYDILSGYRPAYQGYDYLPRPASFDPFGSIYHPVYMGPLDIMSQHNFSPAAMDFVGEMTASTRFNVGWYPQSAVTEFTLHGVDRCLGGLPSQPDQSYSFTLRPWDYEQYCTAHPSSCGSTSSGAPAVARFVIADGVAIYIEDARR